MRFTILVGLVLDLFLFLGKPSWKSRPIFLKNSIIAYL
ncbi:hypothetical protein HMPREF9176_0222 [Streptococcus downei F0415]|nr:hypothetical protein HMPREF9176_0222 [Streptococcus downei F0415]